MRVTVDEFYWESRAGVLHRGLSYLGVDMTAEGCNRDDAVETRLEVPPEVALEACGRCFPGVEHEAVAPV